MKKFLLVLTLLAPLMLSAQEASDREMPCFQGYAALTSNFGFLQGCIQVGPEFGFGCQVSDHLYAGFQTGFGMLGAPNGAALTLPLGGEVKGFWPVGTQTSLFLGCDVGVVLVGDTTSKPDCVCYVGPKFGVEFRRFIAFIGFKGWTTKNLAVNYMTVGIGVPFGPRQQKYRLKHRHEKRQK